jgi:hypothetical protein
VLHWRSQGRPLVARFEWDGWPFELFGDSRPVDQQRGWLHFEIERRLLALDDGRQRKPSPGNDRRGSRRNRHLRLPLKYLVILISACSIWPAKLTRSCACD